MKALNIIQSIILCLYTIEVLKRTLTWGVNIIRQNERLNSTRICPQILRIYEGGTGLKSFVLSVIDMMMYVLVEPFLPLTINKRKNKIKKQKNRR